MKVGRSTHKSLTELLLRTSVSPRAGNGAGREGEPGAECVHWPWMDRWTEGYGAFVLAWP